jgi:hypothetical protein
MVALVLHHVAGIWRARLFISVVTKEQAHDSSVRRERAVREVK